MSEVRVAIFRVAEPLNYFLKNGGRTMTPQERAKRVVDGCYNPERRAALSDARRRLWLERIIMQEIEQAVSSEHEMTALEIGAEVRRLGLAG